MSRHMYGYTLATIAVGEGIALLQHPSWGAVSVTLALGLAMRWIPSRPRSGGGR